mmetsp:Transcript_37995/g.97101  ORF Transcript_37995/g.97101 Transcript_37995/m.97101 type:complete len:129 (-) Transcript_37995:4-390(-)
MPFTPDVATTVAKVIEAVHGSSHELSQKPLSETPRTAAIILVGRILRSLRITYRWSSVRVPPSAWHAAVVFIQVVNSQKEGTQCWRRILRGLGRVGACHHGFHDAAIVGPTLFACSLGGHSGGSARGG